MNSFWYFLQGLWNKQSPIRITLNERLFSEVLQGRILDLGSGGSDRYSKLIPQANGASYELFDMKQGKQVNFEIDSLPYEAGMFDTVLLLNVLEHIYNHKHLLREVKRILKPEGVLVGYVPFLMWYHPDHHDFFRYTHESLELIFKECGYTEIKIEPLFRGPYTAAFQMMYPTIPYFSRPLIYVPFGLLDWLFRRLRPGVAKRYALGYYFKVQ